LTENEKKLKKIAKKEYLINSYSFIMTIMV